MQSCTVLVLKMPLLIQKDKSTFFDESIPQVSDVDFTDMNLSRPLLKAINSLGFTSPTPIQANTIPVALMGKDICACAATGTGGRGKAPIVLLFVVMLPLYGCTHPW